MEQLDTLVTVTRNGMGHADAELQHKLFGVWLQLTLENGTLPGAIACYTDGVRVACEGSPFLEQLRALEAKGVHVILCKTCLDSFGLTDKVAIGVVGGMGDIIAAQTQTPVQVVERSEITRFGRPGVGEKGIALFDATTDADLRRIAGRPQHPRHHPAFGVAREARGVLLADRRDRRRGAPSARLHEHGESRRRVHPRRHRLCGGVHVPGRPGTRGHGHGLDVLAVY